MMTTTSPGTTAAARTAITRAMLAVPAYTRLRGTMARGRSRVAEAVREERHAVARAARKTRVRAREQAEDAVDEARGRIRRSPFASVGGAMLAGAAAGALAVAAMVRRR